MEHRCALVLAHAVAGLLLTLGVGCTSTGTGGEGVEDGAATALEADSDADAEAPGVALCATAGGQCTMHSRAAGFYPACTLVGPAQACDTQTSGGTLCCAVPEAGSCAEISASNYDQSCTTDSDCVLAGEGSSCSICMLNCPHAAINVNARAQYMSDIANTTAGISSNLPACQESCGIVVRPPCCVRRKCQADDGECVLPDVPDAAADAGVDGDAADAGTGDVTDARSE